MRGRGAVLLALLVALLFLAPVASAQGRMCRATWGGNTFEYPCGSGEAPPPEPEEESPWWATERAQAIVGLVGIVASAGAGGYTFYRVRTRRRMLTVSLAAIERTFIEAKSDPDTGMAQLAALRAQLRRDHARGRLDDAHFLELDKRATQYLVKLRLLEIDRRFVLLPPLLLGEIRRVLSDGVLTATEADMVEARAAAYRVPEESRAMLAELVRRWAGEDAPREGEAAQPIAA